MIMIIVHIEPNCQLASLRRLWVRSGSVAFNGAINTDNDSYYSIEIIIIIIVLFC